MADTNIRFKIGSTFDGEGFLAASKAIKENRQELSSSVKGLGELTKAFENLSPQTANAVAGIKTFTAAFMTGGIVGGVIELAIKGVAKAIEYSVEKFHEAAEAAKKYAQILRDNVLTAMGDTSASFSKLCADMDTANKQAKDLLGVLNGDVAHEAAMKVAQEKMDAFKAVDAALSETEKAVIEAASAYKIALINATAKEEETANTVEAYRKTVENAATVKEAATARAEEAETLLAEASAKTAEYQSRRAMAIGTIETIEKEYAQGVITLAEHNIRLKDARLNLSAVEEKYKDDATYLANATAAAAKARDDAAGAEYSYTQAQQALHVSTQKHDEAVKAVTLAELEGQQKIQDAQRKHTEALDKETQARAEEAMKALDSVMSEEAKLQEATKKLAEKREKAAGDAGDGADVKGLEKTALGYPVNVKNHNQIGSSFSAGFKNVINLGEVRGDIVKPKKLDDATFNRIKEGTASVADFQRFNRYLENEETHGNESTRRIGADAVKFLSNINKPDSWLSERDRQFNETFKTQVLPQLPIKVAEKLLGDASKHILCTESLKEVLTNQQVLQAWFGKLGLK